jgi:hypothetical protein
MTIEISGYSSEQIWNYENSFYWFSDVARLSKLFAHEALYKKILNIPGDIVEFGVFKAVSLIRFATFRKIFENENSRKIIGFDSFGKFPRNASNTNSDSDFIEKFELDSGKGLGLGQVQEILNYKEFTNIELVGGDIFDTLPKWMDLKPHARIALLHLDMDVYAPTKLALDLLWDRVVPGGLVLFDDYSLIEGETLAVEEFLKDKKLELKKDSFYHSPSYVVKPHL